LPRQVRFQCRLSGCGPVLARARACRQTRQETSRANQMPRIARRYRIRPNRRGALIMSETIRNRLPACSVVGQPRRMAQTARSTLFYPLAWACFWAFFPWMGFHPAPARHYAQHEPHRQVLRQCHGGELLSHPQDQCASQPLVSHAAARLAIFQFIEAWYNRQRLRLRSAPG
jgi:hypothetical protein